MEKTMGICVQRDKSIHNTGSLKILLTCCFLYGAIAGMLINCNGQFYQSIADSLGVSLGKVTFSSAIMGVVSFFTTPFAVRLYHKMEIKKMVALSILTYALSHMMTGFVNELWQFYLLSVIRGIFQGFLVYYVVSSVINAWFSKEAGKMLSLTAFSSGVTGIFFNMITGVLIGWIGWRSTLIISCVFAILVSLPGVLLYLKKSPQMEKTAVDSDSMRETEQKITVKAYKEDRCFLVIGLCMAVLMVLPYCYSQHLKVYAVSEGFDQLLGASLLSVSMGGNIISKLLLSIVCDKIGAKKSTETILIVMAGFLFLLLLPNAAGLYIGAFFLGMSASFIPILIPRVTAIRYKGECFEQVYSTYSTVLSMASAMWISIIGFLYSWIKSYRPLLLAGVILAGVSCLL